MHSLPMNYEKQGEQISKGEHKTMDLKAYKAASMYPLSYNNAPSLGPAHELAKGTLYSGVAHI